MNRSFAFFRFRFLALLILLPLITGCLVIEKKTLVLMIPEKSEEIYLYYTFEGLGVLDHQDSTLRKAIDDLRDLEGDQLSFFVLRSGQDSPLLQYVRFKDLNYYLDPNRERKLCAERQLTIANRTKFVKELNQIISGDLRRQAEIRLPVDSFRLWIQKTLKENEQNRESSDELGLGVLAQTYGKMLLLLNEMDQESLKMFLLLARRANDWIHVENGTIQIHLPTTQECAQKICSGEFAKKWPKELESFVSLVELKPSEEGIAIVIGKKGQPIQLQFSDTRKHRKDLDADLISEIGPVVPIQIDGKPANGKQLIERFVEKTKKSKK
jgi:hypothetical protein